MIQEFREMLENFYRHANQSSNRKTYQQVLCNELDRAEE